MAVPGRHRSAPSGRPVALVAALTAAVALGAGVLGAVLRDGGRPPVAPESLDRPAPVSGPAPDPAGTRSPAVSGPAIGTLRAAPPTTRPSPPAPVPSTAPAAASRARTAAGAAPGRATFYTLAGLPNCGYPDAAAGGRYVALGPADFRGSAACGTVLDVAGPNGTVRVTVSDLCPECGPGRLDLAAPAFAAVADPGAGTAPVTYARVVDPPTVGPVRIRVKEGSSRYWLALLPMDTGNPLTAVEVKVRGGWQPLARSSYGYWIAEGGTGPGPAQVRLTDDRGHTATAVVPVAPGTVQDTGTRLY